MFENIPLSHGTLWKVTGSLQEAEKRFTVVFSGEFDDSLTLTKAWEYLSRIESSFRTVHMDLGQVTRINSLAVPEWMTFTQRVRSRHAVTYSVVSEAVLELTALIKNFLGRPPVVIEKFYTIFYCDDCDKSERILVDVKQQQLNSDWIDRLAQDCQSCSKPMQLDESPDSLRLVFESLNDSSNKSRR